MNTSRFLLAKSLLRGLWAAAALLTLCGAATSAPDPLLDTGLPVVRLFDVGAPLPDPLGARPAGAAWTQLPEGAGAHAFRGDAVVSNDRIALVLRKGAAGAELYSKRADGLRLRALLCPRVAAGAPTIGAVTVTENSPSAVELDVAFQPGEAGPALLTFRMTTGDAKAEVRCQGAANGLTIRSKARRVVVPDFFADDMVFGAGFFDSPRVGLPAENFFLTLLEGSDCILMCVWDSAGRDADMVITDAPGGRVIDRCEIDGSEGARTWVAVLEGPGIWHAASVSPQQMEPELALDWTPPFPAKWRADLVGQGAAAQSWDLRQESDPEEATGRACACRLEGAQALIRLPQGEAEALGGRVLVVYPIDRSRATPLNAFCPIDVVRSALGVGPCQYILAMEGLDQGAHPTPADVTQWVEKQFERKRDARQAEAIRERLDQMAAHVAHTQERIREYAAFAAEVRELCAQQRQGAAGGAAEALGRTAEEMARALTVRIDAMAGPEHARRLADGIVALIGQEDAPAECARLGAELRAIGAAQDSALAASRMAVRWLRQQCRMLAASELARDIQSRAERMLRQR